MVQGDSRPARPSADLVVEVVDGDGEGPVLDPGVYELDFCRYGRSGGHFGVRGLKVGEGEDGVGDHTVSSRNQKP